MKVKIKLSIDQFKFLIDFINRTPHNFGELTILNIRLFLSTGFKRLIDLQTELIFNPYKVKTFAIEINQYHAVLNVLAVHHENLDAYTRSIFETLKTQNKAVLSISN